MNTRITDTIDQLIERYKEDHKGEAPLYIVLTSDEIKEARETIRKKNNHPEDYVITTYRDIKLAEHPSPEGGKMYVSNDLPDTGS